MEDLEFRKIEKKKIILDNEIVQSKKQAEKWVNVITATSLEYNMLVGNHFEARIWMALEVKLRYWGLFSR